jgi:hypothetical protein
MKVKSYKVIIVPKDKLENNLNHFANDGWVLKEFIEIFYSMLSSMPTQIEILLEKEVDANG